MNRQIVDIHHLSSISYCGELIPGNHNFLLFDQDLKHFNKNNIILSSHKMLTKKQTSKTF